MPGKPVDYTGIKTNNLTAIRFSHSNQYRHSYWLFRCDCGKEKVIGVAAVNAGKIKTCGCSKQATHYDPVTNLQTCIICKISKDLHQSFYKQNDMTNGYGSRCKSCIKTISQKKFRMYKYGMTFEKYLELVTEQNSCCFICENVFEKLVVDHNHETGNVRKLLCQDCNKAIGFAKENPEILKKAAAYIEKFNGE